MSRVTLRMCAISCIAVAVPGRMYPNESLHGEEVSYMQIAYITFTSRQDQVRGFYALATKAQVTSVPGGVYAVPWKALALLDAQHIAYRRATEAEVPLHHGAMRTPVAPVLSRWPHH